MRRLVIAVLLSLPLAAACGSTQSAQSTHGGSGANIRDTLISAAGATAKAGSAKIAMSLSMSAVGPDADEDGRHGRRAFNPRRSETTIRYTASPLLGKLNGMRMTELLYGSTVYIRSPLFSARAGKPWVKMASGRPRPRRRATSPSSGASDPTQVLGYLRSVSTSIQRVGTERVRGVETTHYRAVVDYAKMADRSARLPGRAEEGDPGDGHVEGADGCLAGRPEPRDTRRHEPADDDPGPPARHEDVVRLLRLRRAGEVKPPPANQVADMSALLGTGNTSTGSGSAA